ncbi:MAG: heparinase II/III family protein [Melioribacteraceae bacterium]|nr:heparinase II/III family protein [Melioribacteraceae bacterium]
MKIFFEKRNISYKVFCLSTLYYLISPLGLFAQTYNPPIGIPIPEFGIEETVESQEVPNNSIDGTKPTKIIGNEALLNLDSRMLFSALVNYSPGNGMDAEVNPPRFRWYYVSEPKKMDSKITIKPNRFRFQVADNKFFLNPLVNVDTEINFYNELAPFPEGKKYYWRVGYILYGETEPSSWTKTFAVNIPEGTPKWDRSILKNPNFKEHPRLLFNQEQLEELRATLINDPIFIKDFVGVADSITKHKWWNNWPKTDLNKPEYTYGFYYRLTRELTITAFTYLITGNEKYKNILDIWKTIASYPKGGASSPEGMGVGADSEDNTSITEFLACIYDWFYNDFSEEDRAIFEKSMQWRLDEFMYDFMWGGAIFTGGKNDPRIGRASLAMETASGHSWEGALDTYPAALVMYEKSETARRFFRWVTNFIISVGENVAQNGGYDIGSHYSSSHLKWLIFQLMYLKSALPELELGKNPLYQQYSEYLPALVPIGMEYSHFGRIGTHGAGKEHRMEVFNLLAYITESGETLNYWRNLGEKKSFRWRPWIHAVAPLQFTDDLKPITSSKTKFIFPATGFVMAHSAPPTEPYSFNEGVGVIFCSRANRGDKYNNENTFQMYAYGKHLNFGGHSGDENPYGFQTIAHNTIMVDGIGQTWTEETRESGYRGVTLAYQEGDNYTYWMGDATNAYPKQNEYVIGRKIDRHTLGLMDTQLNGSLTVDDWALRTQIDYDEELFGEKGAPKLERFRRHMLFIRDKYLVVYDDLKTAPERPSRFSWRYRVLPESNAKYNSDDGLLTYTIDDVKVLIKQVAFPESLEFLDMKDLDQYKNPITGNDYMKNTIWTAIDMKKERYRNKVAQHNFWFTNKEPQSNYHFLTLVYPVKPGTDDPVITRLDNNTVKIEKDGEVDIVSFDKDTEFPATIIIDLKALREPISFSN